MSNTASSAGAEVGRLNDARSAPVTGFGTRSENSALPPPTASGEASMPKAPLIAYSVWLIGPSWSWSYIDTTWSRAEEVCVLGTVHT